MKRIGDICNRDPKTIRLGATMREAAALVSRDQCSDIMVIDDQDRFAGVLSEGDLIRAVIPRLDELISAEDGSLTRACEVFTGSADPGRGDQSIDRLIIRNAIVLHPDDDLLKAGIVMVTKQIRRLPVVDGDQLIGTVSRADLCLAILS
ncbi:MAG: CBS domain-containing protein [Kiritimatiellia bacterium]|jgi:CBS domain-containing protein